MDCGDTAWCDVLNLVFEQDDSARKLVEFAFGIGGQALDLPSKALATIKEHLGNLIALAAFCFGVWKWWVYRETILHKRLFQYLRQSDLRLIDSQNYILDALNRPAPGQSAKTPLFANKSLRRVLERRQWGTAPVALTVEQSTQKLLDKAVRSIEGQLRIADQASEYLRKQLASAHIMKGAIAASALTKPGASNIENFTALGSFRTALQIPSRERNLVAREFEAHQLRKLGELSKALLSYLALEEEAKVSGDYRTQRLLIARSRRYRAEIIQARNSSSSVGGTRSFRGSTAAYDLLSPNSQTGALALRANFAPYRYWEELEQGDLHFLTAFVAMNLRRNQVERDQLTEAQTAYSSILDHTKVRFWQPKKYRHLRQLAHAGLNRVSLAKSGQYDTGWLPPLEPLLLQQPKQQADGVSAAARDGGVAGALQNRGGDLAVEA